MGFEWLTHKKYKRHYICLHCQKGFKRPPLSDMKEEEFFELSVSMEDFYASNSSTDLLEYITHASVKTKPVCPQCKGGLRPVPYIFEVPSKNKKKNWKDLEARFNHKDSSELYEAFYYWHLNALTKTDTHSALGKKLRANKERIEKLINTP